TYDKGNLSLECPWTVKADSPLRPMAVRLQQEIAPLHPKSEIDCLRATPIALELITPDTLLSNEWYALKVAPGGITISATTEAGLYRGTRTLVQLLEQGQ